MKRKYFGTDGVRGRVGKAPITPYFVMKLGYAAGKVLAARHVSAAAGDLRERALLLRHRDGVLQRERAGVRRCRRLGS